MLDTLYTHRPTAPRPMKIPKHTVWQTYSHPNLTTATCCEQGSSRPCLYRANPIQQYGELRCCRDGNYGSDVSVISTTAFDAVTTAGSRSSCWTLSSSASSAALPLPVPILCHDMHTTTSQNSGWCAACLQPTTPHWRNRARAAAAAGAHRRRMHKIRAAAQHNTDRRQSADGCVQPAVL
jgi:hypothetical protein